LAVHAKSEHATGILAQIGKVQVATVICAAVFNLSALVIEYVQSVRARVRRPGPTDRLPMLQFRVSSAGKTQLVLGIVARDRSDSISLRMLGISGMCRPPPCTCELRTHAVETSLLYWTDRPATFRALRRSRLTNLVRPLERRTILWDLLSRRLAATPSTLVTARKFWIFIG